MLEIGKKQSLVVIKKVDFGVYLAENMDSEDKVLLPAKQVPEDTDISDRLEVFLYRDSSDRLIATTNIPKLTVGDVGILKVKEVTRIGAFMDFGLERDVLMPFREQTKRVSQGESVLCALYVDKSGRLAATMNVYEYLRTDSPYQKDDHVQGTVYETSKNFGTFVAVDDIFSGLIPKKELVSEPRIGDTVRCRVIAVRDDGKLDLSIREKAYMQIDDDAQAVLEMIKKNGGSLPFTDKSDPVLIKEKMHMSKNQFKRAVGHLYKERQIVILENGIKLV